MMITNWERKELGNNKTVWQHDTGIRIFLMPVGPGYYQLFLYNKAGAEQYHSEPNNNRAKLERESAMWQRDYNRHLKKNS